MKHSLSLTIVAVFVFFSACTIAPTGDSSCEHSPRIVNIINFIRYMEPRYEGKNTPEILYQTVVNQAQVLRSHDLKGTWLLQYDALIQDNYQQLMHEELARGSEVGAWWEITQPHVEAAGMQWRGRFPWDWHTNVGFAVGYTPEERIKLVDVYMEKFKEIFGQYPASVGSWFIDAYTLNYLSEKYHIKASCNCRDQYGTDGYTLWGGYWGQGYYPSKTNAYMPAQTEEGAIPVPIFRMLGSDPIYQYEAGMGGARQHVVTLEPAYDYGGGDPKWVDWYFNAFTEEPALGYHYVQSGQENSFVWEEVKVGFPYQMERIRVLSDSGKVIVKTLAETGEWFKTTYKVTPPTSLAALKDYKDEGHQAVWFNSRYYRASLLWEAHQLKLRDIHLFDEHYPSVYYSQPTTSTECRYLTLPIVDGCLWGAEGDRASLFFCQKNASGEWEEITAEQDPVVKEGKDRLEISWPLYAGTSISLIMDEAKIYLEWKGTPADRDNWALILRTRPDAEIPFTTITPQEIQASQSNYPYSLHVAEGQAVDLRTTGQPGEVFRVEPKNGKITFSIQ